MLQPATLKFISSLSKNNNKPWFDEHRDTYLAAKEDFENFVGLLLKDMACWQLSKAEFWTAPFPDLAERRSGFSAGRR